MSDQIKNNQYPEERKVYILDRSLNLFAHRLQEILTSTYNNVTIVDSPDEADVAFLSSMVFNETIPKLPFECVSILATSDFTSFVKNIAYMHMDSYLEKNALKSQHAEELFKTLFEGEKYVSKRSVSRTNHIPDLSLEKYIREEKMDLGVKDEENDKLSNLMSFCGRIVKGFGTMFRK